jgi:hypothetical protein
MYGEKPRNSMGKYGEIGVTNPSSNIPSAGYFAAALYDTNSKILWLFGSSRTTFGRTKLI